MHQKYHSIIIPTNQASLWVINSFMKYIAQYAQSIFDKNAKPINKTSRLKEHASD